MKDVVQSAWFKGLCVLLIGLCVLVLKQFGTTGHVDLQALALETANQIDKLLVGGWLGAMLADKPNFMRNPSAEPEDVA
jgi:hypothetical protein